jgi:hypothetical protein
MTKEEKQRLGRLAAMGCIACRLDGNAGTPAEIHHLRETAGMGQRAGNDEAIPLCPAHHRGTMHRPGRDGHVPSVHMDRLAFVAEYGNESELLARAVEILGGEK